MKKEVHLIPDLILGFEVSFTGCREKLADAVDRIMSLVQTLPCVQGRLEKLHLTLMEALTNAIWLDSNFTLYYETASPQKSPHCGWRTAILRK
jgi:hypothetical protein